MSKHQKDTAEDTVQAFVDRCASTSRYYYHAAHLLAVSIDLCLDERCAVLIGVKGDLPLTKSQKVVFCTLLEALDCPVSAEALGVRLASDYGEVPLIKTVRNTISLLRKRLAQLCSSVRIQTRYNYGYCLRVDLRTPQVD
jgi:DNA-binding response OmpR family regulator